MRQPDRLFVETRFPTDASERLRFYFITFFIGLSYILIMSQWNYSVIVIASSSKMLSTMPGITGINSMKSALGKSLLGIVGAILLFWPSNTKVNYRVAPLFFFSGYLILCFSSVIWSVHSDLTVRRLLVLLLFMIGILGTVRHLSTRQLLDTAIVVSLAIIALGLTAELVHGTFTPMQGNYRFTGTMHPNSQGSICAVLVLSAYCRLREAGSKKLILSMAIVIGIVFLFLTKSRSNILACFIAAYLTSFWKTSFRSKQLLILIPFVFICLTFLILSLVAYDFSRDLDGLVNLGRELDNASITSFNGRVPLWVFLKDYIQEKPLLGYGFQAFWTPNMIQTFGDYTVTWAGSGHSVIIDLLLQLGFAGTLPYILSVITVFYWAVKDCASDRRPEVLFTFAIMIYAIIFGFLESIFLTPQSFGAFVASVALFNCCMAKEKIVSD